MDPFGEGSTTRRASVARNVGGDRLTSPGPASDRPTASTASFLRAYSAAVSSRQRYGSTSMPRSTATLTAVVNDSTSTTATTVDPGPHSLAPRNPQSNRTRHPCWS